MKHVWPKLVLCMACLVLASSAAAQSHIDRIIASDAFFGFPVISADGRFVVFTTSAADLVPGDGNAVSDVFSYDSFDGSLTRVSVSSAGEEGNDNSRSSVAITPDGRFIAFESQASNLVPSDLNGSSDVFLHDRAAGTTELISTAAGGGGNGTSAFPSMDGSGRYVSFRSNASNLVAGDGNNSRDIFVRDRHDGTIARVSISSAGAEGNDHSQSRSSLSVDGRLVVFQSAASNLVIGDSNNLTDVFLHDRRDRRTLRISVSSDGKQGDREAQGPAISADGRYIAFVSGASNLVPTAGSGTSGIYLVDAWLLPVTPTPQPTPRVINEGPEVDSGPGPRGTHDITVRIGPPLVLDPDWRKEIREDLKPKKKKKKKAKQKITPTYTISIDTIEAGLHAARRKKTLKRVSLKKLKRGVRVRGFAAGTYGVKYRLEVYAGKRVVARSAWSPVTEVVAAP